MAEKCVLLITGGNTGLGLETVKALCKSSIAYDILLGSRSMQKAHDAISSVQAEIKQSASSLTPVQVDISDDASINKAFEEVAASKGKLDVLINNAGGGFDTDLKDGKMSMRDAWNKGWDLNVAGTQVMTHTFAPLLLKSSDPRLMFIASGTSTLQGTENTEFRLNVAPAAGWPKPQGFEVASYRSSKAGMNMMMRNWERVLRNDGVKVFCVSPGMLATGLQGIGRETLLKMGALEPSVGAEFIRDVVEGKRDQDVGKVIAKDGRIQPW